MDPVPEPRWPRPAEPGEEIGGWSVDSVDGERGRLRVRLSRPGSGVTLEVHLCEGNPRRGPFDAGPFRVYTESSAPLPADLVPAGRELGRRVARVPPGEARKALRSWSRKASSDGTPELFELGSDPFATLGEVEAIVRSGVAACLVRGALGVVSSPEVLERLVLLAPGVRVEATVDDRCDDEALVRALSAVAEGGLRLRLVVEPTATTVAGLAGLLLQALSPLPAAGRPRPSPVEAAWVHLPSLEDYAARHLDPPRLSEVSQALAAAHGAGAGHAQLSSRLGEPLCHSPRALRRALLTRVGEAGGTSPRGGAFAASCEGCALRPACTGLHPDYARRFGTGELVAFAAAIPGRPTWAEKTRWLLAGWPGESVTLAEVMEEGEIPRWPCHLPWTRLELGGGAPVGPCCASFQAGTGREPSPEGAGGEAPPGVRDEAGSPEELWNGPRLRSFRRAVARSAHPETCRRDCPVLLGGTHRPAAMILWGGPAASVESQIVLVEEMRTGAEEVRRPPQSLCVATTSYCNYDCIMCGFGEHGSLEDEKPASFWKGLEGWLGSLQQIDANGGEPLASPEFRGFLERADFARRPQLGISLTTNLSYLTPAQLDRFSRVPFISFTVSLNAATAGTYSRVMRGLPFEVVRGNLDTLLRRRAESPSPPGVTYSFVILKQNLGEVGDFYEMAKADGVAVRFMLPEDNRNDSSIMTSREAMEEARRALAGVAEDLARRGLDVERSRVWANVLRLDERLASGILVPL